MGINGTIASMINKVSIKQGWLLAKKIYIIEIGSNSCCNPNNFQQKGVGETWKFSTIVGNKNLFSDKEAE